jgi:O-antigen ligase
MQANFANIREKTPAALVALFFVLFIIMLPRYTDAAKTWFVLLILGAFLYLLFDLKQLSQTDTIERVFLAAILLNFAWLAFSHYVNGASHRGASFLWGRHFYFIFIVPLFFLFRKIEIPDKIILLGILCSVVLSLGDIAVDLVRGVSHRGQGMNPNKFGPIQLCLTGILFFFYLRTPDRRLRWLSLLGFVLALCTVLLSQSRSTWMTALVLCIFFVFYLARSISISRRFALILGIFALLSSSYLLPIVKSRIDLALVSIPAYFTNDDYRDKSRLSPFGIRMELWKTGWKVFLENPLVGIGAGNFQKMAQQNSERYRVNKIVHKYKYVHNQYIATLATSGVPGLILLLIILLTPIYISMSQKSLDRESGIAGLSLILICLTYLVGSVPEDHFEGKSTTMFVGVMLPLFLAKISVARHRRTG